MQNEFIIRAAEIVGSRVALAEALDVTPGRISQWATGPDQVPHRHAVKIEELTGGAVKRWDLCPDDWHLMWPELRTLPNAPKIKEAA